MCLKAEINMTGSCKYNTIRLTVRCPEDETETVGG